MAGHSLDGAVDLDYAPSGVTWRLTCPAGSALESEWGSYANFALSEKIETDGGLSGAPGLRPSSSGYGPPLPTLAMQQVGSYPGYTGRDAKLVAKAALDPSRTPTVHGSIEMGCVLDFAALRPG